MGRSARTWNILWKSFEYLATMRPILATGGTGDVVTELLNETNAGIDAQTLEHIKRTLRELHTEYKLKGKVTYNGILERINRYSCRETAKKFVEILNTPTGRS